MKKVNEFRKNTHPYNPIRKISVVWYGFWYVMRYDFSVTYKVIISSVILCIAFWFQEYINAFLLLIATGNMLTSEILNSCIELLCNFKTNEYNKQIKTIKDVSATAAGISIAIWLSVVIHELYTLYLLLV